MEWLPVFVVVLVALVVCVIALAAVRARRRSSDLVGTALAEREQVLVAAKGDGPVGAPDQALVAEIRALLGQGKKINAIKLLRSRIPMGLAEAKQAVEEIEAGRVPAHWPGRPRPQDITDRSLVDQATDLKRQGRLIEAVKLVRQRTGLSLREAKDLVDNL